MTSVAAVAAASEVLVLAVNVFALAEPRLDVVAFNTLMTAVDGTDSVLPDANVTSCNAAEPCETSEPTVADPSTLRFPLNASNDISACSVSFSKMNPYPAVLAIRYRNATPVTAPNEAAVPPAIELAKPEVDRYVA